MIFESKVDKFGMPLTESHDAFASLEKALSRFDPSYLFHEETKDGLKVVFELDMEWDTFEEKKDRIEEIADSKGFEVFDAEESNGVVVTFIRGMPMEDAAEARFQSWMSQNQERLKGEYEQYRKKSGYQTMKFKDFALEKYLKKEASNGN